MRLKKLPRSFYLRPTITVARDLLGKYLVRAIGRKKLVGRIVEVEAYCEGDPASHSFRGMTERNKVMFGEGGHLYVYFTYGMHFCANVGTREEGIGEAVLIRAVEPIAGTEVMAKNRSKGMVPTGASPYSALHTPHLTNGPAKVCQAFGIARKHNGVDLCSNAIWIAASTLKPETSNSKLSISSSPRIGIRTGRERKWWFYVKGSSWASKPNRV